MDRSQQDAAGSVRIQFYIVPHAGCREESVDAFRREQPFRNDPVKQMLRIIEQFLCPDPDRRVLEYRGIMSVQLPRMEKRRPIDVGNQLGERLVTDDAGSKKCRLGYVDRCPIADEAASAGLLQ